MRKFFNYSLLFVLMVCSAVFSACASEKVKAGDFEFRFNKNSAQIVSQGEGNYVRLKLDVKNLKSAEASLLAEDFRLKSGEEFLDSGLYFGNNIIDEMTSETLGPNESESLILNFLTSAASGEFEVYYLDNLLVSFKL